MEVFSKTGKMFIDGEWVFAETGKVREIINPADGTVLANVTEGTASDTKKAIAAAKRAFYRDGWADTTGAERAARLFAIADLIEKNTDEFAKIETMNNGKPLRDALYDVSDTVSCFRYYAGLAGKPMGQTYSVPDPSMQAMTVREPVGVCGLIVPWNYPLMMAGWKIAPALAAGNTVVFKPAGVTPLSAIRLFKLMEQIGFPKGVINLVLGPGGEVGNEIAGSPDVDMVAFTGGTDTGRSIMRAAAGNIKKIGLELGGKSPNVMFGDVDIETAVDFALFGIFCNQGEVCSAGSRLLLEDTIYDAVLDGIAKRAPAIKVANGLEKGTEMGPLVSKSHMEEVLKYIDSGIREGARLVCGGRRMGGPKYEKGFFVEPTVFADCTRDMRIVREEIFGPVLAVMKFHSEEEAVELANDTVYGLAGGVFSKDASRALRVVKKLRAGITWVNHYHPTFAEAPWGGYKQSGIGRELGTYGLEEYTEVKQINVNLNPGPIYWFEKRQ
jgi:betaine-aldehyde dehydrogenase